MKIDRMKLNLELAKSCMLLKDVCEKAGISQPTLRKIRAGERNPTPATIGKIAKALGVAVSDLIEGDE